MVYLNGKFVPEQNAKISCMDRGFLFADGVYEVTAVLDGGRIQVDADGHFRRLQRSLSELQIDCPAYNNHCNLEQVQSELIRRNQLNEGVVYLQITRGATPDRDFFFPTTTNTPSPTVFLMTQSMKIIDNPVATTTGMAVVTVPDLRWRRRDIKTTGLLAQVLAKQAARDAGAQDAWMVDDRGKVTEGASSNAFIVKNGHLVTRNLSNDILHGITRRAVLERLLDSLDEEHRPIVQERGFTVDEACQADEAFSTSSSTLVMPVVRINDTSIGDGKPGPITLRLRKLYIDLALSGSL